ncbi:MAG: D-2-hydroxyacid dehydrogenase family protein [Hyphomicrobiaceae bacterium]
MARIAILDDFQNVALGMADWSRIKAAHEVTVFDHALTTVDEVAAALQPFEIVCIMRERTPFPRALIEKLPNLKLLVTTGMRNASVDLAAAMAQGIVVCGTPSGGHATAELAMALVLGLARNFHVELAAMREGRWQSTVGLDLRGRTMGLLGLGKLGSEVARFAQAFGMRTIAWSQNLTAEAASGKGVTRVEKDDLFRQADFLSVHLVLSQRSRGLVGQREIGLMKPTAYIVNTSRGPIVDADALAEALKAGRIAGAAMDVYETEPLPADHPIRREPRALLTPHIGYVTEESYRIFFAGVVENIEAWLAGKPTRVLS